MDRLEELMALEERIERARTLIQDLRSANRALSSELDQLRRGLDTQEVDREPGGGAASRRPAKDSRRTGKAGPEPSVASLPPAGRAVDPDGRMALLLRERTEIRDKIEHLLQRLESLERAT